MLHIKNFPYSLKRGIKSPKGQYHYIFWRFSSGFFLSIKLTWAPDSYCKPFPTTAKKSLRCSNLMLAWMCSNTLSWNFCLIWCCIMQWLVKLQICVSLRMYNQIQKYFRGSNRGTGRLNRWKKIVNLMLLSLKHC